MYNKIKQLLRGKGKLIENFSYITALQLFLLIAPLITYPYLVKVLGREIYGLILTAQMLASYASLFIDFGSNSVCAKHVSINRESKEKLSEIVSSVFIVRSVLFISLFAVYMLIVWLIPTYRQHWLLFLISYGLTLNEVLFPQYFFQGIEQMKQISIINIITKLVFIVLVFFVVKTPADYLYVPLLYTIGYAAGGLIAIILIFCKMKLRLYVPDIKSMLYYVKDSSAVFATDLICTIKDKFNYMLVGSCVGMSSVVIYDLSIKINGLISKPVTIINTVMFPRLAKSRNTKTLKLVVFMSFVLATLSCLVVNAILPWIVNFFLHDTVDLLPIRILLLAPIFLSASYCISQDLFIAFGYNKYVFYSIIVTSLVYIISLAVLTILGLLHSIYAFVALALISYFAELIYRLIKACQIIKQINN